MTIPRRSVFPQDLKEKKVRYGQHPEVQFARVRLQRRKEAYNLNDSEDNHQEMKQAQEDLYSAYKKTK